MADIAEHLTIAAQPAEKPVRKGDFAALLGAMREVISPSLADELPQVPAAAINPASTIVVDPPEDEIDYAPMYYI
jgi:hypothetical protein